MTHLEEQRRVAVEYVTRVAGGGIDERHYASDMTAWTLATGTMTREEFMPRLRRAVHVWTEPLVMTIDAVIAEPGRVVVQARSRGVLITGAEYTNSYMFLVEFDLSGRIRHVREYFDVKRLENYYRPAVALWQASQGEPS